MLVEIEWLIDWLFFSTYLRLISSYEVDYFLSKAEKFSGNEKFGGYGGGAGCGTINGQ